MTALDHRSADPIEIATRNWREAGWSDAADGMALITGVVRAQQILVAAVERRLRPLGLTFARFEVLRLLAFSRREALPMGVVGRRLQVHPASVTSAVDRLEADGWVHRTRSADDGRMVLVGLTTQGRSIVDEATARLNELFASLPIDEANVAAANHALAVIRGVAGLEEL
ncbi:MAG: MarR family winged helix-turn-helix transcriptional regulator [Ilumatobacteraceae bacterium]|jgi:DNA-binding MarR family transcriptional regulator